MLGIRTLITMTSEWARWRLKSPASRLFSQPFIQAQIIENIKAPRHWPLCGEFTGDRRIPLTKGQQRGKCFHLMTTSRCHSMTCHFSPTHLLYSSPLRWRHNDHAGVSNHQPHGCLLNRLFRRKSKKTSKLRVTGLCAGNSPGTGEFPAQMASYAENVSIWWRHHGSGRLCSNIISVIFKILWICLVVNATIHHWWWVNNGSGNGLVPSGNKPLPDPMLAQICVVTKPQ